jgi:hypothetical protein
MTPRELVEILKQHERYATGQPHGTRAILENQVCPARWIFSEA